MVTDQEATATTSLAARLRHLMDERNLTGSELSRLTGGRVEPSTIIQAARVEDRDPRVSTVVELARALGVTTDYLAGLSDRRTAGDPAEHVTVPLVAAPPGPSAPPASDRWITVPREVLQGDAPDYALWVPSEEGNIPGLSDGDILVVSRTAAPVDRCLIVVRDGEGFCVRQYREVEGIILAETLAGDLSRLAIADILGVGVWLCHWM